MKLQKIKVAGFKSFVDPTTIAIPCQIIGIVGPNGCGKSNVIDAVRWVMGESSAKHLRGESLADVIFNGSTARKPVGSASVELIFDNTDSSLGGQYANYNEIAIKRKISRDGQSIYYLNGSRCRRRDITDIFLGTGLGPRSYAIIEQGTISRLIEAKPDELRVFLEEAAGISKYKERRRETENRIKATRENINRVSDLIDEIEKRLSILNRQAKTAEKYKTYKQEERLLKAQLTALKWQALEEEFNVKNQSVLEGSRQIEGKVAELRNVESEIEKLRQTQHDVNENFNRVQGQFYSVGADIARVEQTIAHSREKTTQNETELQNVEESLLEVKSHVKHDCRVMEEIDAELERAEPTVRHLQEAERGSSDRRDVCEKTLHNWQAEWDQFNKTSSANLQAAEVERTRINHIEDHLIRLRDQLARIESENAQISVDGDKDLIQELGSRIDEAQKSIDISQDYLEKNSKALSDKRYERTQNANELRDKQLALGKLHKQQASHEALQSAALGKSDQRVNSWLEENKLHDVNRLAEMIRVDKGWEHAVETVLGMYLEAICLTEFSSVASKLPRLKDGSVVLFETDAAHVKREISDNTSLLMSKVNSPWNLESLLAGIYICDSIEDALIKRKKLANHESIITRDGVWYGVDWVRMIRREDETTSVLLREKLIKQVGDQIKNSEQHILNLEQTIENTNLEITKLEQQRELKQIKFREISEVYSQYRQELVAIESRLNKDKIRKEQLEVDTADTRKQIINQKQQLHESRDRLQFTLDTVEKNERERKHLIERKDELRVAYELAREEARVKRDEARDTVIQIESKRTQKASLVLSYERLSTQAESLEKRYQTLITSIESSIEPLKEDQDKLEKLLNDRLGIEESLSLARKSVDDCDHATREFESQRASIDNEYQKMRDELQNLKLDCQEIKVIRQTQIDQLAEMGYDLESTLEQLTKDASEVEWRKAVQEIERKISRLGAINLAAIDEHAEESKRKEYLDSQFSDLNNAISTLENAIRKIDNETRTRFKDTFERANSKLQEFFPRLFGGGIARLEMTGDSLLDSGVTIIARPPGKRNSSIHLLSGGEKALTAVALVFSLFELNPAPFCLLDEVDAPLDDANAERFCHLIQEMSDRVQFIFITHNKITMELAQNLVGVTMHEPGASRLVAVDVDQAVEMAAVP